MKCMMYKNYPLVRKENEMYYGYMGDAYVIRLQAEDFHEKNGIRISGKVKFYQMSTDEKLNPIEAIVKNSERDTLYDALDVAAVWLKRANAPK